MREIEAYRKSSVQTSPDKLLLMLFDGLSRFCRQSQQMMIEKSYERANEFIKKAQSILVELMTTLKHDVAPELCSNLYALYDFMYRRLIEANVKKEPELIDVVINFAAEMKDAFYQASLKRV